MQNTTESFDYKPPSNTEEESPVVKQPTENFPLFLGPTQSQTKCPYCQSFVKTTVKYRVTSRTHSLSVLLCCCCCCCIPYCCNSARNTDHYCPSCKRYLGTYEK